MGSGRVKKNDTKRTAENPLPPGAQQEKELGFEPLINKPVAAHRIGRTTRGVELLMAQGLPHYKIGAQTAFLWSEILIYLVENCRVCRQGKVTK
jgi:hypothetical protein